MVPPTAAQRLEETDESLHARDPNLRQEVICRHSLVNAPSIGAESRTSRMVDTDSRDRAVSTPAYRC
jgi:hypothetical protein